MKFVWHWPFFVFTLEERVSKAMAFEKSFLYHIEMTTGLKTAKEALLARLQVELAGLEGEISQAQLFATNYKTIRTKMLATVDETVQDVDQVIDDVKDLGHDVTTLWPHSPTDGADNPR